MSLIVILSLCAGILRALELWRLTLLADLLFQTGGASQVITSENRYPLQITKYQQNQAKVGLKLQQLYIIIVYKIAQ